MHCSTNVTDAAYSLELCVMKLSRESSSQIRGYQLCFKAEWVPGVSDTTLILFSPTYHLQASASIEQGVLMCMV